MSTHPTAAQRRDETHIDLVLQLAEQVQRMTNDQRELSTLQERITSRSRFMVALYNDAVLRAGLLPTAAEDSSTAPQQRLEYASPYAPVVRA